MFYDYLTGQPIDELVPESYHNYLLVYGDQPGYITSFDNSPYDTLLNNFYYDGANYYYFQTDSAVIDFSANPVFNGTLFPPIEELYSQTINNNQFGFGSDFNLNNIGNSGDDLALLGISGAFNTANPVEAASQISILSNGGLQNLVI